MEIARSYEPGDEEILAPRMREADKAEVFAASGVTPLEALQRGIDNATILCTLINEKKEVVGIFGAEPDDRNDPHSAWIWMLGSDGVAKKPFSTQFLRQSRTYINALNNTYPVLHNFIDERNTVHMKWLEWCGFTFIRTIPHHGYAGLPFREFARIK